MAERTLLQRDARLTGLKDVVDELRTAAGGSWRPCPRPGRTRTVRTPTSNAFLICWRRRGELSPRLGGRAGGHRPLAPAWVEANDVRKAPPADTVFVDVARVRVRDYADKGGPGGLKSEDRYLGWVITAADGVRVVDLGPAAEVDVLAHKLLKNLKDVEKPPRGGGGEYAKLVAEKLSKEEMAKRWDEVVRKFWAAEGELEKGFRATSTDLSKRVLHPLLKPAGKATHWIVCPDADLWLIPWAALVLPDDKYFMERFTLRQVVSGRDLLAGRGPGAANPPLRDGQSQVFPRRDRSRVGARFGSTSCRSCRRWSVTSRRT